MEMILCVGHNNTCRSAMFEVMLRQKAAEEDQSGSIEINSAGISQRAGKGRPASTNAKNCMDFIGLSLRSHRSRWISDMDLSVYGTIICMDPTILATVQSLAINSTKARIILANSPVGFECLEGQDEQAYSKCAKRMSDLIYNLIGAVEV